MRAFTLISLLVLTSQIASASIVTVDTGTKTIEGVNVAHSALVKFSDADAQKLDIIGAGLRTKKVLVANVKVYVVQLFVDNGGKFVRTNDGAVASLKDMNAGLIRLSFVRDVDAQTVQVSFRDALEANDVDINNPGVAAFLKAVSSGADAQNGKSLNISLQKMADGKVQVVYENTKGGEKTVIGDADLFSAIFSIWIGTPADSGLTTLKAALLKGDV